MKNVYRIIFSLYCVLIATLTQAQGSLQGNGKPEMAVGMRANGKIYVVVAVVVTILLGLFFYLLSLEKKIGRLEKEAKG